MVAYNDYGVAMGDVYVAARLSALFEHINKPSQVRIGTNYSFEDLRNSPAVVVGAFNNRWTMQMTSNLRFVFTEQDGQFRIQEQGSGRDVPVMGSGPEGRNCSGLCHRHTIARRQDRPSGDRRRRTGCERDASCRRVYFQAGLPGAGLPIGPCGLAKEETCK